MNRIEQTVPLVKPGKYGSSCFVRASANLWNSLRGERASWFENSLTVESFTLNHITQRGWIKAYYVPT